MAILYVDDGYVNKGYVQTGVSINWGTGVIFVPVSELSLIQQTPTLIYELNLNYFRLTLKDLEDDAEGMPYPITHIHNTEVSLGGLTYARVIEIIEPYTVTFEDGAYAVNLVGANSNVGDRVNVNQVSVRSANSAGLTSAPAMEYSSFNEGVTLDTSSPHTGTTFPVGTPQAPVNNLVDANLIRIFRGFNIFYIIGNLTLGIGDDVSGITLIGQNLLKTVITVDTLADTVDCEILKSHVFGVLDGGTILRQCLITDISYVNGYVYECILGSGAIVLGGNHPAIFLDCKSGFPGIEGEDDPTIDMGGSGQSLAVRGYNGDIAITNKTGDDPIEININSGHIELDVTVTQGEIEISGSGKLNDNTTPQAGLEIDISGLSDPANIAAVFMDTQVAGHSETGSVGAAFIAGSYNDRVFIDVDNGYAGTDYPIGLPEYPVNNLDDAMDIMHTLGLTTLHLHSNLTVEAHQEILEHVIEGHEGAKYTITLAAGCDSTHARFEKVCITGTASGSAAYHTCILEDLYGVSGGVTDCTFNGVVELTSAQPTKATGCRSSSQTAPTLSVNGGLLNMIEYYGMLNIANKTGTSECNIHAAIGFFEVLPSCTSGTIMLTGNGHAIDNSNGSVVNIDHLVNKEAIAQGIMSTDIGIYTDIDTVGNTFAAGHYNGVVYIDAVNGVVGVEYGIGLANNPSNNVVDAMAIAILFNLTTLHLHSDLTVSTGTDISELIFISHQGSGNTLIVETGCITNNTSFNSIRLSGYLNGRCSFHGGSLINIHGFRGRATDCILDGDIWLEDSAAASSVFEESFARSSSPIITIDVGASKLSASNLSGYVYIAGKDGTNEINLHVDHSFITVQDTCTEGSIFIVGDGIVVDESTGTCVVDTTYVHNKDTISAAVWDVDVDTFLKDNTTGFAQKSVLFIGHSVHIDTELVVNGDGSQSFPFNVLADALDYAETSNIYAITIYNEVTIDRNLKNYIVNGVGLPVIECNGNDLNKTHFSNCTLRGTYDGSIRADECDLDDGFILNGGFLNCGISATVMCAIGSAVVLVHPFSMISGIGSVTISMNPGNTCTLAVRGMRGGLIVSDCDQVLDTCTIEIEQGALVFDETCVAGEMVARGVCEFIDNTTGATVIDETHDSGSVSDAVWSHSVATQLITNIDFIKDIEGGKWEIVNDQMLFYNDAGNTEIARFNLYNNTGTPAEENIYKRERV